MRTRRSPERTARQGLRRRGACEILKLVGSSDPVRLPSDAPRSWRKISVLNDFVQRWSAIQTVRAARLRLDEILTASSELTCEGDELDVQGT
jgi:hypothetical protein